MSPSRDQTRVVQTLLNKHGGNLVVDGIFGAASQREAARQIPWTFKGQPSSARLQAAVVQTYAKRHKVNAGKLDSYWGPQTAAAADDLWARWTKQPLPPRPDEAFAPCSISALTVRCWTPTDDQMRQAYGKEGDNQVRIQSPYELRLDCDLHSKVHSFVCHRLVAERISNAMADILKCYGPERIRELGIDRFGGCLNVRKKRGGKTMSTHSWGVALDWYPSANQLRWDKSRAAFARAEYLPFMQAWARQGFMSLGTCYDFDWMHVQANPL